MNIRDLKMQQKAFYKSIVSIFCPILNDAVYFTSDGFHHLLYDGRKPRNINEQYMKLKCLQHAPDVIKNCTQISEIRQFEKLIKGKSKTVFHYELVYEISSGKKIRVVIEKIGTGRHKFLSVMPHDRNSRTKKHP